jgi:hypothetical protein
VKIEGPLICCQPSIAGLLERGNAPGVQWISTVCPDPVASWKKCVMFLIDTSRSECVCIMDASRVTKRIINYEKIVGHNDCLEFILIFNHEIKKKKHT